MSTGKGLKPLLIIMMIAGLAIITASFYFLKESGLLLAIWSGVGLLIILTGGAGLIFSNLYVKARGNLAYYKTGKGGGKVIKDNGMIVIAFLHELIPVSLETMKIEVDKKGKESLITKGGLRAEIKAEFYIRVRSDEEGIRTAAERLGDKISSTGSRPRDIDVSKILAQVVSDLENTKLIDALRTVAGTKTLEELNLDRSSFKKAVMEVVKDGLEQNGLELEDVTISHLDQAPKEVLDPNNTFDAEGLKNLQQKVSAAQIERNQYEREAQLAIKERDVATQTAILTQEQELAFKTADQQREVRTYGAEREKEAAMAELTNQEAVAQRQIEKDRAVQLAGVEKDLQTQRAQVAQQREIETANVEKQRQIEITERERQIAIAKKEQEQAAAEAARLEAEQKREAAAQGVKTIEVTAAAQRDKERTIIAQQADIEKKRLERQMEADTKAYAEITAAEAEKRSAENKANAVTTEAQAKKDAKLMEAEGLKAEQMVPVEVQRQGVEVERARVEVMKNELAAKAEFETIAKGLQVELAQIEAGKAIGLAFAQALGDGLSAANLTIWGDPSSVSKISEAFMNGQLNGSFLSGLLESTPREVKDGATSALEGLQKIAGNLLQRLTPQESQVLSEVLKKVAISDTAVAENK